MLTLWRGLCLFVRAGVWRYLNIGWSYRPTLFFINPLFRGWTVQPMYDYENINRLIKENSPKKNRILKPEKIKLKK